MNANGIKKYLLAVVGALLIEAASVIWWAAELSTRVNFLEKVTDTLSERVHAHEVGRVP